MPSSPIWQAARLSEWIEANVRLPEGVNALPGAVRLWPYQREIADAISDPAEPVGLINVAAMARWADGSSLCR